MVLIAVAAGIVLAASAGLRAFMPLFGVGLASRLLDWSIAPSMDWLSTDVGLIALGIATVVELAADKLPMVDHALDVVHTIAGPVAGALVTFSIWGDLPPAMSAILAIALGAPVAGAVHAISATTRVKSSVLSAGAFNPAAYVLWEPEIKNFGGIWGPNVGHDASQYPNENEGVGRRHKKGAVITGFSGQVHFIKFDDFQREQRNNKPGLLWCVPGSPTGQ